MRVQAVELGRVHGRGDDHPHPAALEAVDQVVAAEQLRGRDHHRADLDAGQHQLPQRHLVAQHQQHPVAARNAQRFEPVRDPGRSRRHLRIADDLLAAVVGDDPQRGAVVVVRQVVEVVQRPVEMRQLWPAKARLRSVMVAAVGQQKIARSAVVGQVLAHCCLLVTGSGEEAAGSGHEYKPGRQISGRQVLSPDSLARGRAAANQQCQRRCDHQG